MPEVITNRLDLWTSALLTKSTAGRGSNGKLEAYGIKKLRELILELAVRGKLLPQDPGDEPAAELLKRVEADKARLVKCGDIKKDKNFPAIAGDEIPYDLPQGWQWARINDVGHDWGQKTPNADFTYIDVSAIDNDRGLVGAPSILRASDAPSRARKIVRKGTVIYSTVRPYLKNICAIEEDYSPEPIASTAFAILHPLQDMPGKFFALYFRSPEFVRYVEAVQTGIAYPAINDKQFYGGLVPVPPLAEQHRIVAKVDELMALCDQLEQQQGRGIEAHQTLVETLLGTLTNVESAQEFSAAWNRIAEHFDTLFTTEHSIDQLKQTILQLAVMGKLVPQKPGDEPASILLKKIANEKERLVREGVIRTQQRLAEVGAEEMPFALPRGWTWARLGDVGLGSTGKTPGTGNHEYYGGKIPFIGPGQITLAGEILGSDKTLTDEGCKFSVVAEPGDILMVCIGGSIGKTAIVFSRVAFNQQINCLRPMLVNPRLMNYSMNTSQFQAAVLSKATGSATPIINRSKWEELLVQVPPELEQARIVAKVDELMALCDALKARLAEAQATQIRLADAIVERAVAAPEAVVA